MEELSWFGNTSFTQAEIDALEKAIEDTQRSNTSYGVYHLLEDRARKPDHPEFYQYQIDAFLESRGLKPPDTIVPPRTLGSYALDERIVDRGSVLPSWWTRGDGAILYMHRWWGTTAPAGGWREYAWFKVKSALEYEQASEGRPIEHYMHKRRYWSGEQIEGSIGRYRPLYSVIVQRGEIDLG